MFSRPIRLALEVKYLDRAVEFYRTHLDLSPDAETETEAVFAVGEDEFRLRAPRTIPRGGVHTHFAFATPPDRYAGWRESLSTAFDLAEVDFGGSRSLYFDDADGHCVEIGQRGRGTDALSGIFEIVLEVEDLDRAEAFYTALGLELVDRGDARRRVRLDAGPLAIELWEPQLGLADARGGLHVDFGVGAEDPEGVASRVEDRACRIDRVAGGVRVRDPDGHSLTLLGEPSGVDVDGGR